ncbi:MAG: hypothetical protein ABIN89_28675 [Chitinophagaceae bacterium]
MAKKKSKGKEKIPAKKLNRVLIEQKLEEAFSEFKTIMGEKKFQQHIRKAGKLLNKDFSKKDLDNLRKLKDASNSAGVVEDDTSILIEELP